MTDTLSQAHNLAKKKHQLLAAGLMTTSLVAGATLLSTTAHADTAATGNTNTTPTTTTPATTNTNLQADNVQLHAASADTNATTPTTETSTQTTTSDSANTNNTVDSNSQTDNSKDTSTKSDTQEGHKVSITVVDTVNNNKQVVAGSYTGKVGDVIKTNLKLPDGYQYVTKQTIPEEVTIHEHDESQVIQVRKLAAPDSNDSAKPDDDTNQSKDQSTDQKATSGMLSIVYKSDKDGHVIGTQAIGGNIGDELHVKLTVPSGYKLVDSTRVPDTVKLTQKDQQLELEVTADDSAKTDDTQTETQTITFNFVTADGKTVDTKTLNGKLGSIVSTDSILPPNGYQFAEGVTVPAKLVVADDDTKNWTLLVTPINSNSDNSSTNNDSDADDSANNVTKTVKLINTKGETLASYDYSGKAGSTMNINLVTPSGYHVVDGSMPTSITFDKSGTQKEVVVKLAKDGETDTTKKTDANKDQSSTEQKADKTTTDNSTSNVTPNGTDTTAQNSNNAVSNEPAINSVEAPMASNNRASDVASLAMPARNTVVMSNTGVQDVHQNSQKALPQTGNSDTNAIAALGAGAMVATLGMMFGFKKRQA